MIEQQEVRMNRQEQRGDDIPARRTGIDRLAELQPEATSILVAARSAAATSTDDAVLSLCRDYIESILLGKPWLPPPLSRREQAFVSFTEQFMISVGSMSDRQVAELLEYATADEVYAFVNAMFTMEMSRRVELVSEVVLP
jgi:hypothetical protein